MTLTANLIGDTMPVILDDRAAGLGGSFYGIIKPSNTNTPQVLNTLRRVLTNVKVITMATSKYTSKDIQRFWIKVNKNGSVPVHCPELGVCWEWVAGLGAGGYGAFRYREIHIGSHRVSWELIYGEIQDGMKILHKCDNPKCVCPDHLFIGTMKDNVDDRERKGRSNRGTGEKSRHHKLTWQQVDEIKAKYAAGGTSHRKLMREYGVARITISRILSGKNWKEELR